MLSGSYDTVTCIDVLIHYPTEKMDSMVGHLCNLAEKRFIISFAPYTPFYAALKWIGSMAPGPSKVYSSIHPPIIYAFKYVTNSALF